MKTVLNYIRDYLKHVDKILPLICLALTVFDLYVIYSMTKTGYISNGYFKTFIIEATFRTQIIAAVIGIIAAIVISAVDYRFISKIWFVIAPVAVILQLLLFTPLGVQRDDDIAWLDFGIITIQPAEILKFVYIVTLATHISKLGENINSPKHLILVCIHGLAPAALIIIQKDIGSALVFVFMFICMLFMSGISWKYLLAGIASIPLLAVFAWNFILEDHHKTRVLILFDKDLQEAEKLNRFYQQYNGTIVLGSGQLTGLGFDQESYHYTSELSNDFIFAYIGMTLGFIGCMTVVIMLALLCLKLLSNASGAQTNLGKLICIGVFAMIFFHCVINIGVVLCVVPVIGIPLPFISRGGTAIIMVNACMGLVLSVSAHREKEKHMFY
ncbi:MAG: FtsW/RodA/SpoVE family cell cycle protein [Oscillospiraceae bacterium]|nr:FtsW/RodA/SpoVE family cell cycle protein [Oscillospiraceae bacterium]